MIPDSNSDRIHTRRRQVAGTIATCGATALLGVLIGATCLPARSWPMGLMPSKAFVHVSFGLLLCGLVVLRFIWWLHRASPQSLDVRRFSRELSRMVYLILYLVFGTQLVIRCAARLQLGDRVAQHLVTWSPASDGQAFLVCGLIALVLIRVLAYWIYRRLAISHGLRILS